MHESPRLRRLRSDLAALERLRDESSVLRFKATGKPVHHYVIEFRGKSLARLRGRVTTVDHHEVEIKLGAAYPRSMPEIRWLSPIYHPNISEIGMVCLGGYGTHWVPSLNLDELCGMLWDMARYHNYDVRSPYNREAALWVANQTNYTFPIDSRPLRDLRAALGRVESEPPVELIPVKSQPDEPKNKVPSNPSGATSGTPALPAAEPEFRGTRASRYADFVRKFAEDLKSITPGQSVSLNLPEGLIILDDNPEPSAEPTPIPTPAVAPNNDIMFID